MEASSYKQGAKLIKPVKIGMATVFLFFGEQKKL